MHSQVTKICHHTWKKCSVIQCTSNKPPFLNSFPTMTSRNDVIGIKQNQICNLPANIFYLRYHSTMSDLRIEKSPFFTPPLWRHNQKFGGQWRHQKFGHILKTLFWEFGENIQSRFCARRKRPHFGHFSPTSPRERDTRTHAQQHYIKI